jgi:hypothetical protein
LPLALEQACDAHVLGQGEIRAMHGRHEARRREALSKADTAGGEQAPEQVHRRGEPRRLEREALVHAPFEWHAQELALRIHAHQTHEPQRLGVGPDQDVQAVVERDAVLLDAPRAPAERARRLEDGDGNAALRQGDRGRHAGVAAANNGDFHD